MNTMSSTQSAVIKRTHARYWIVVMLFIVTLLISLVQMFIGKKIKVT